MFNRCARMQIFYVQHMHTHVQTNVCKPMEADCSIKRNHMRKEWKLKWAEGGLEQIEGRLKEIETAWGGGRGGLSWDNIWLCVVNFFPGSFLLRKMHLSVHKGINSSPSLNSSIYNYAAEHTRRAVSIFCLNHVVLGSCLFFFIPNA